MINNTSQVISIYTLCVPWLAFILMITTYATPAVSGETDKSSVQKRQQCVILLHGLARTYRSMQKMEKRLKQQGFTVVNFGYPSTRHGIEYLSTMAIPAALKQCDSLKVSSIHFVTHSLGGILVRYYLAENKIANLGHVVMLSPPNQGSEVVDKLKHMPGFTLLNGPAGHQLGTDKSSIPLNLGPADFDVGIITGNRTINLLLSTLIPGGDDGKVSIQRARLDGMKDFIVAPSSHPFIMKNNYVIEQVIHYLENGTFDHSPIQKSEKF